MEYNRKELKTRRQELRRNQTKAELKLWEYIRNRQIEGIKFRRQFSIDNFVVDFYSPELKFAIEADGDTHFKDEEVLKDVRRQKHLEKYGIRFLRFTNIEILEAPDFVINKIRENIKKLI